MSQTWVTCPCCQSIAQLLNMLKTGKSESIKVAKGGTLAMADWQQGPSGFLTGGLCQ